ncbi:MAG: cation diffusion facilitator family transporter [Eggerthellaceae bacterium]|nr:cation diffusion facilitator family transporter [Eggerthellaceae bacterium]
MSTNKAADEDRIHTASALGTKPSTWVRVSHDAQSAASTGDSPEEEQVYIHGDLDEEDDSIDDNVADTDSIAMRRHRARKRAKPLSPAEQLKRNRTVISAVAAGVIVSVIKFITAAFTGSVAMLSEGVHSLVDAANDSLMLVGARGSKRQPDLEHPFGYGRMVYFYTFIVSVVILLFGGGFTIMQGISALQSPETGVENPVVAIVVLLVGTAIESVSLSIAFREVNQARGDDSLMEYIRTSKAPTSFTVLLEDTAAVLGMLFALAGIVATALTGNGTYDAIASIAIGALMAIFAVVLVRETSSLLIGEGLDRDEIEDIVFIVEEDPAVIKCGRVLSMYMGPKDMVLNLDVTFDDELDEGDILQAIDRVEAEIVDDYPQCSAIFIEVESLNQVYRQRADRALAFQEAEED